MLITCVYVHADVRSNSELLIYYFVVFFGSKFVTPL